MAAHAVQRAEPKAQTDLGGRVDKILCPVCRRHVFSCSVDNIRLRTRILVFDGGNTYAKCRHCKHDVIVPLIMFDSLNGECLSVWNEALDGHTR